jgi:hypothetical protein
MKTRDGACNSRYLPPSGRYPNTPRLIASRCGWTLCKLHRPRQWGACWLACWLYEQLGLDHFWQGRLPDSREGTRWRHILQTLVVYRLLDPGSEWRLHRLWFEQKRWPLLGADYALVEKNTLYRCLDKLLLHKRALSHQLTEALAGPVRCPLRHPAL